MAPPLRPATYAELDADRALAAAVAADDRPAASRVLDATPGLATLRSAGSPAPLLLAVRRGWTPLVTRLVALGAPLDTPPSRPDEHLLVAAAAAGDDALFGGLRRRGVTLETFVLRRWSTRELWRAVFRSDRDALASQARAACASLSAPVDPLLEGVGEAAGAHRDEDALALVGDARGVGAPAEAFGPALARALAAGNPGVARALLAGGARLAPARYVDAARLWPPVLRRGDLELAELILDAGFDVAAWEAEHGSLLARWPEAHPRAQPVIARLVAGGMRLDRDAPALGTPLDAARRAGRPTLHRFLAALAEGGTVSVEAARP